MSLFKKSGIIRRVISGKWYINDDYRKYVQKLKWFGYLNKLRHEMNIINEIKRIYGEDAIMIIGDNGGKNRIKLISVPNLGIKRLLKNILKYSF